MSRKQVVIPQEQFKLMQPMLCVSRAFCLAPLKWKRINNDYLISTSRLYIALSFTSIFSLGEFQCVFLFRNQIFSEFSGVGALPGVQDRRGVPHPLQGPHRALCNHLRHVRGPPLRHLRDYPHVSQDPAVPPLLHLFVTLAALSCTFAVLCFDLCMWLNISAKSDNIIEVLVNFFPYYICYTFTMVMEVNYWHFVHLLKTRIDSLNRYLSDFDHTKNEQRAKISRKSINSVVDTFTVSKNCFSQPHAPRKPIQLANIREMVLAYEKIIEGTQTVNNFYGMTILIVVLGIVLHLLVTPYALYSIISTTENRNFIISQSMWMIGHVLRVIFIVEPCHGCVCSSKTTLELACKILCTDLESQLRKEVEMFVVLLSNCKIEFTVYGLTNIDRSLLTAITGAVTTYLVILFQFRN